MKPLLFICCIGCLLLFTQDTGCKTPSPVITGKPDPGWSTFNYPRTTHPPGYVYRIKNGETVPQEVTILRTGKPFDTGYAELPGEYEKRKMQTNAFLRLLFLNPNDSNLKYNKEQTSEIYMQIGKAFSESLDEPAIDSLIKKSGIIWRDDNRYFIIQSTLSTRKIKYKFQATGNLNTSAILNLKPVGAGGSIHRDNLDSTWLDQDFDMNYRVYYQAIEINASGAAIGNGKPIPMRKVKEPTIND